MTKLSPSILSADFAYLARDCAAVQAAGADMLHIDVMDGHFVPNISYGAPVLKCLHKALPEAFYDVHLMVSEPVRYAPDFVKAGAGLITFHYEAVEDVPAAIAALRALGCQVGISIKPATPATAVLPFLSLVDLVLVMSVEPGFGGQKFMPEALEKLGALRTVCATLAKPPLLEVDGGVDLASGTAAACVQAGADVLVAGSAVFGAPSPAEAVKALRAL